MLPAFLLLTSVHHHSVAGTWDWFEDGSHSTIVFQSGGSYCRYLNLKPGYLVNRGSYTFKSDLLVLRGSSLTMNGQVMRRKASGAPESYHLIWDSKTKFHWLRKGDSSQRTVLKHVSDSQKIPSVD